MNLFDARDDGEELDEMVCRYCQFRAGSDDFCDGCGNYVCDECLDSDEHRDVCA